MAAALPPVPVGVGDLSVLSGVSFCAWASDLFPLPTQGLRLGDCASPLLETCCKQLPLLKSPSLTSISCLRPPQSSVSFCSKTPQNRSIYCLYFLSSHCVLKLLHTAFLHPYPPHGTCFGQGAPITIIQPEFKENTWSDLIWVAVATQIAVVSF